MVFFIKRIVASEKPLTSLVKKADFPKDSQRLWQKRLIFQKTTEILQIDVHTVERRY